MNKQQVIREIENHLRHYKTYKIAVKNCLKQLDYLLPSTSAKFYEDKGTSGFVITSSTEKSAIDRIESKRALDLHEQIEKYKIFIDCIDNSMSELTENEREFISNRYFNCMSISETARKLGYSEKNIYYIRKHVLEKMYISLSSICCLK
jgi:RNA polymerase sigma factor (sigma-70 family)